jgi:hypothetical protein
VANASLKSDSWVEGYWQTEKYFADHAPEIGSELMPPTPISENFLSLAREIEASDSVCVGVRLFEEMPGADKSGVGGLVPLSFYQEAAQDLQAMHAAKPCIFFVFCTRLAPIENKLKLPGKVIYVTHDNGYTGQNDRLWLISRCKHHILSNSSFYWWGAWLAERTGRVGEIMAADLFPNEDTIPERWQKRSIK